MSGDSSESGPAVVLVGLGRVGAQAPAVRGPDGGLVVRNHLEAIKGAGGRIVALVDRLESRRQQARARYGIGPDVADAPQLAQLSPGPVDVVSIATPPEGRLETLAAAIALRPKAIVLEKPPAVDAGVAEQAIRMAEAANVALYIAFNRRTDPGMVKLVQSVPMAQAKAALFRYGKGLVNYGSHAVDHALQWFGPAAAVQAAPWTPADPDAACVSFRCIMQSGLAVDFIGVAGVTYDVFEAEIYLPDRVVGFRNNGVEKVHWKASEDLHYPGYTGLVPAEPIDAPRPIGGFVEMYQELFGAVREGRVPRSLCTAREGLAVLRVLAAAVQSAKSQGCVVPLSDAARGRTNEPSVLAEFSGVEHGQ